MAQATGVFAEPASSASWAGLKQAIAAGQIGGNDRVVVVSTGNGLKDVGAAMKAVEATGAKPHTISPTMDALNETLTRMNQ